MKAKKTVYLLLVWTLPLFVITSCEDDDEGTDVYWTADVKLNSGATENYDCNEYAFEARVDTTANDTLVFEGERTSDNSYMYFNLITEDLYQFASGDSIAIPYDIASDTEVFCSLLINSVSSTIFQPGGGVTQGKIYIDEIDYSKKYLKGRFYGTFYSFNDSLTVSNATFLIDK